MFPQRAAAAGLPTFNAMPTLTIIGLGPSDASLLTLGALERLERAPRVALCNIAPTLEQHQTAISGNICRCTGYRKILDAMQHAAEETVAHSDIDRKVVKT